VNKVLALKYIFGAVFIVFYQIIIAPRLTIAGIQSNMAIILSVWVALNRGSKAGTFFGFTAGLLIGFFTPADLGWAALILALIGFSAGSLKKKLVIEPISTQLLVLLAAAFIFNILFILTTKFGLFFANPAYALIDAFYAALYSAFIGVIIFYIIRYRYILRNLF